MFPCPLALVGYLAFQQSHTAPSTETFRPGAYRYFESRGARCICIEAGVPIGPGHRVPNVEPRLLVDHRFGGHRSTQAERDQGECCSGDEHRVGQMPGRRINTVPRAEAEPELRNHQRDIDQADNQFGFAKAAGLPSLPCRDHDHRCQEKDELADVAMHFDQIVILEQPTTAQKTLQHQKNSLGDAEVRKPADKCRF